MSTPSAGLQHVLANPAHFEELVGALQNMDNNVRNQAETIFNELKEQPDACVQLLVQTMRHSQATESRMFCAIMLRKVNLLCKGELCPQACSPAFRRVYAHRQRAAPSQHEGWVFIYIMNMICSGWFSSPVQWAPESAETVTHSCVPPHIDPPFSHRTAASAAAQLSMRHGLCLLQRQNMNRRNCFAHLSVPSALHAVGAGQ